VGHLDGDVGEVTERAARRLEVSALLDGRDETLRARLVDAAVVARRGHVQPELDEHLVLGKRGVVVGHLDDRVALLRVGLRHVIERHLEGGLGAWEVGARGESDDGSWREWRQR